MHSTSLPNLHTRPCSDHPKATRDTPPTVREFKGRSRFHSLSLLANHLSSRGSPFHSSNPDERCVCVQRSDFMCQQMQLYRSGKDTAFRQRANTCEHTSGDRNSAHKILYHLPDSRHRNTTWGLTTTSRWLEWRGRGNENVCECVTRGSGNKWRQCAGQSPWEYLLFGIQVRGEDDEKV